MSDKKNFSDEQWQQQLSEEEFNITRKHGTERAFTGKYWDSKQSGQYTCKCCGEPLFLSDSKFDSGTGWPSFFQPIDEKKSRPNTNHQKRWHPPAGSGVEALGYQVSQWLKEEKEEVIKEVALGKEYGTSRERSVLSEANS